jgi:alpha-L-arabinofuranosidase
MSGKYHKFVSLAALIAINLPAASFLNACLRHSEQVTMANIAPLVNTRGPLQCHRSGGSGRR